MPEPGAFREGAQGSGPARPRDASGDRAREAREAFADGFAFEALREHLGDETRCVEWCPICRGAEILRANASPELIEGWQSVQREALLTVRALIDHYLERIDREPADRAPRVRDIPIE
jgi:hypothetical protein